MADVQQNKGLKMFNRESTEMKLRALMHDIMTVRHALLDKEDFLISKINDTEKYVKKLEIKIDAIEKYLKNQNLKKSKRKD